MSVEVRLGKGLFQENEKMKETLKKNAFLEQRISEILNELQSSKQETSDTQKTLKKLESQLGVLQLEIDHLSQKYSESQKRVNALTVQLSESEKAYLELTKETEDLRKMASEQQMVLRVKQEEEIKLKDQLTIKDAKAFTSDSRYSNIARILEEKEKEIELMQKTILHKNQYIEILMNDKHRAILATNGEGSLTNLNEKKLESTLIQENMKLKETVHSLTIQNNQMREDLDKKQKELVTFIEDNRFLLEQIRQPTKNNQKTGKPNTGQTVRSKTLKDLGNKKKL